MSPRFLLLISYYTSIFIVWMMRFSLSNLIFFCVCKVRCPRFSLLFWLSLSYYKTLGVCACLWLLMVCWGYCLHEYSFCVRPCGVCPGQCTGVHPVPGDEYTLTSARKSSGSYTPPTTVTLTVLMWRMAHQRAAALWTPRPPLGQGWCSTLTSPDTTSVVSPFSTARTVTMIYRPSPCHETPPSPLNYMVMTW